MLNAIKDDYDLKDHEGPPKTGLFYDSIPTQKLNIWIPHIILHLKTKFHFNLSILIPLLKISCHGTVTFESSQNNKIAMSFLPLKLNFIQIWRISYVWRESRFPLQRAAYR